MARLFAAEVGADLLHLLEHVAVPDLGLDRPDSSVPERLVEPEIRHHGGHDHTPESRPLLAIWRPQMASA